MSNAGRRLAAILAADVAGYSRLMGADEEGTIATLKDCRNVFRSVVQIHPGRVVDTAGDSVLAVFQDDVTAVRYAIEVQDRLAERNADRPEDRRMRFRIGINSGTIVEDEDGTVYGDGVNVAARLEGMAEPGGILISQKVRETIADKLDAVFLDNGERKFKNIARPIRVWSWPRRLAIKSPDGKPVVFVAGFEGRSEEERQLGADLGDEFKAHLSRLTGLEVAVERNNAQYVVVGTVRQAAGRSRVFARLVGVEGDKQLWSERYDEDTDDPFEVLDNCVPRMAMSVRRRIAAVDAERLANRNLEELSLEELLALAGASFFTPTKAGWSGGGHIAEQALELAPRNFMALAMAAAGLGLAEYLYGFRKPEDAVTSLAFRRLDDALRLNNRSDMLHATHACLLLHGPRRHHDGAAAARRALEFNPDYNMGLWQIGAAQTFAGDYDAGAETATRAVNIDIRDPYVHLYSRTAAYGHLGAERHGEATGWFRRADQLAPGLPHNLIGLAVSSWLDDDEEGARLAVARLLEEEPEFRISEAVAPPYRDDAARTRFVDALRRAGAPD